MRLYRLLGSLVTVLILALLAPPAASGMIVFSGATATYTPTLTTALNKIWRKVQSNLMTGWNFMVEEWEDIGDLQEFDVDWSTREIIVPLDINEGYGVASIPEGGWEARPSSINAEELSLTWIMLNKRFTATKTARYIDEKSRAAMVKRQLTFQGKKALEDIARDFGDKFWGLSTAYLAQTSTNATQSSGVYTLKNAYGSTTLTGGTTAEKNFIVDKFRVGDYVALIRSAALVTNAIGVITAITAATPSITVTWAGSVDSDDLDYVVKANSLENTTIAGTDYNLGVVGFLDNMLSASIHGLSSSSVANWAPALTDTAGGRFAGIRMHRGADEIANKGGGKLNCLYFAQGVYRDAIALERAALRWQDPFAMELDGDVKSKGRQFKKSRRVPPGQVHGIDKSKSLRKMMLLDKPDAPGWGQAKELENQSGYVFSMDVPVQLVWLNRGTTAQWTGLTEQ